METYTEVNKYQNRLGVKRSLKKFSENISKIVSVQIQIIIKSSHPNSERQNRKLWHHRVKISGFKALRNRMQSLCAIPERVLGPHTQQPPSTLQKNTNTSSRVTLSSRLTLNPYNSAFGSGSRVSELFEVGCG